MKSRRNPLGLRGQWTWAFSHSDCNCGHPVEIYPANFSRKHRYLPPYNKKSGQIEGLYCLPRTDRFIVFKNGEHDKKPGKTKGRCFIPDGVWEPERIVKNELWGYWTDLSNERYSHGGMWALEKDPLFSWEQEWFQRATIVAALVTLLASSAVFLDYIVKITSWVWQYP